MKNTNQHIEPFKYSEFVSGGSSSAPLKLSMYLQRALERSTVIQLYEIQPSFNSEEISFHISFAKANTFGESRQVITTFVENEDGHHTATIDRTGVSILINDQSSLDAYIEEVDSSIFQKLPIPRANPKEKPRLI